jgi:hypothetical protein
MAVREVDKQLAYSAGRLAARRTRPLADANPYSPSRQRLLTLWFVRGYRSVETARP